MHFNSTVIIWLCSVISVCVSSLSSDGVETISRSFKDDMAVRDKRSIIGYLPTAHPSRLSVTVMTAQSNLFATVLRSLIGFERKWYDLTSQSSAIECAGYLVLGLVSTFLVIFIPLAVVFNLLAVPAIAVAKRSTDDKEEKNWRPLDFQLPDWMQQAFNEKTRR